MVITCSTSDGRKFKIAISTKQINLMYRPIDTDNDILEISKMWMELGRKFLNMATKLQETDDA